MLSRHIWIYTICKYNFFLFFMLKNIMSNGYTLPILSGSLTKGSGIFSNFILFVFLTNSDETLKERRPGGEYFFPQ